MTRNLANFINKVLSSHPKQAVLPSHWLHQQGISNKLAWWYVQSSWLDRFNHGAYLLAGNQPTWQSAVYSLQTLLNLPIHIGAKTALALLGRAHYISFEGTTLVILFSPPQTKLPTWFSENPPWQEQCILIKKHLFEKHNLESIVTRDIDGIKLAISSPERAVMEVLAMIPTHQSYQEALLLMENLTNLRPQVVQALLLSCTSVKVKRLFLHCAEKLNHAWLNEIDISKVNLGSGIRQIAEGGEYDSKYQLSVPKS